jgi:hypothetical protein
MPPLIRRTVRIIFTIPHKINFFVIIKCIENRKRDIN